MSANQENYEGFPNDGAFWAIKYIDQYQQAHLRTRSTAVNVMLQRLPEMTITQLAALTVQECKELLGRKDGITPTFEFARVLIGELPALSIGAVFQNGIKIGELPTAQLPLCFLPGQSDADDILVRTEVEKPPKWDANMPHRTLNPSEYSGVWDHNKRDIHFTKSRLVVVRRRRGRHTDIFVIPRMTIFKSFYAQHSEIAKAFFADHWPVALERVICLRDTTSGLRTEEINGGAQWNIVLQTLVQDEFAALLAVLMFDSYGRICAESIYGSALQDRKGNGSAPWFASARIPLRAVQEALHLDLKCLELKSRFYYEAGERCEIRKFLVSEICGSSWPSHYPKIGSSRANGGDSGLDVVSTPLPAPFGRQPSTSKKSDRETTVSQEHDAAKNSSTTTIKGSEWNWIGTPPKTHKLQKPVSNKYEGGQLPVNDDGDRVSLGEHTSGMDALPKAEAKTLIRVPNERFEHIIDALRSAHESAVISQISLIRPRRPGQATPRNGHQCWKFIDEVSLRNGSGPRNGWRVIYSRSNAKRVTHWRTAMIFKLKVDDAIHYWIEIECRDNESCKSVLLTNLIGDPYSILEVALDLIAEAVGCKLGARLTHAFADDGITVTTYKHRYAPERTELAVSSVVTFLKKVSSSRPLEAV